MRENTIGRGPIRIASIGHAAFAATMVGFGIQGLVTRDFAPIWEPVAEGVPARAALVYLCALISLASGLGLFWRRTAPAAARLLLVYLMLWFLLLRVPQMFISFTVDVWYSACQTAVIVAAAWVLYAWFAADGDRPPLAASNAVRIGRVFYGLALIPFGLAHFLYMQNTAPLVPHWLPAPVALSYFTGGAFIAAGLAVLTGVCARLAAVLSALQIGLFTLLVWVPIVAAGATPPQWAEFIVSWALTAGAWVVADSYRGTPWLGVGKR